MPSHQPSDVATVLGVSVHTIRRWCEWHGAHLSAGANPLPGVPRRFTDRDIEVMRLVQSLRAQGMQTPAVNERLAQTAIPEIETVQAITTPQESPGEAIAPSQVFLYLAGMEERTADRIANVERQQREVTRHAFVYGVSAGVIGAALFFGIMVLLIWLYTS